MKIQLTTIDHSSRIIDIPLYFENTEEQTFHTFLAHFKNSGYYVVEPGVAILYHNLSLVEIYHEPVEIEPPPQVVITSKEELKTFVQEQIPFKRKKAGELI